MKRKNIPFASYWFHPTISTKKPQKHQQLVKSLGSITKTVIFFQNDNFPWFQQHVKKKDTTITSNVTILVLYKKVCTKKHLVLFSQGALLIHFAYNHCTQRNSIFFFLFGIVPLNPSRPDPDKERKISWIFIFTSL